MPTLLQISIEVNSGSVGRIAEQIGQAVIKDGWDSYITYARNHLPSKSKTIRTGSALDVYLHGLQTRILDNHCLASKQATKKLIKKINKIQPDIIQLHHIHGYFLNMKILFNYLAATNIPIVWVFHDCWSFTGHCAYFDYANCEKWKTQCCNCIQKKEYPKSSFIDRSFKNYNEKKRLFTSVKNMIIVPVSYWLADKVEQSFLKNFPIHVIQNGIDIHIFSPKSNTDYLYKKYNIKKNEKILLGLANIWERRKGFDDFMQLSKIIENEDFKIILVGLNKKQIKELSNSIIGIERTENVEELAGIYSIATAFINPTWEDTFPTTNLESLACGTPVITYNTGGSVESVDEKTGIIVEKGDIQGLYNAVQRIISVGKEEYSITCRERAVRLYDREKKFQEYINLYTKRLNK